MYNYSRMAGPADAVGHINIGDHVGATERRGLAGPANTCFVPGDTRFQKGLAFDFSSQSSFGNNIS